MPRRRSTDEVRPDLTREAVLRFIADNPGRTSKRDIARAFDVKGDERVALKDLLADLQAEGVVAGGRKSFKTPGALPPVAVLEVSSRDEDGPLLAEPVRWDEEEDGERPRLPVRQERGKGRPPVSASAFSPGSRRTKPVSEWRG